MAKWSAGVVLSWKGALSCAVLGMLGALSSSPTQAAAGRTAGSFNVSPAGSATYTIPIFTPPGVRGLQPSVALVYDSNGGVGYLGKGWRLSGFSVLGRCRKTPAQDAEAWAVQLWQLDGYCLDGNRLRLVSGSYGFSGSVYATEIADFSRITADGTTGNGPTSWTVERKDGLIYTYGGTSDSRVLPGTSATVAAWRLSQIEDRSGNKVLFSYKAPDGTTTGTTHPTQISWTQTSLGSGTYLYTMEFGYGIDENALPSSLAAYVADNEMRDTDLLTSISVKRSGTTVRKYVLDYSGPASITGARRLNSVTECSDEILSDCLAATTVTYQNGQAGIEASPGYTLPGNIVAVDASFDFDGDGLRDLAYRRDGAWYVRFASTSGYGAEHATGVTSFGLIAGDPFGNGRDVIMGLNSTSTWHAHIWSGSAFTPVSTGISNFDIASLSLVDVDADGRDDMVYIRGSGEQIGTRLSTSTGSTPSFGYDITNSYWYFLPPPMQDLGDGGFHFIQYGELRSGGTWLPGTLDANGDGREDVILDGIMFHCWDDPYFYCMDYGFSAVLMPDTEGGEYFFYNLGPTQSWLWPVHLNSDACTDFLTRPETFNGLGSNSALHSGCAGSFPSTAAAGQIRGAIDWDGDGRQDVLVQLTGQTTLFVQRSTGVGLAAAEDTGLPLSCGMFLADANGDGLQDVGCLYSGSSIAVHLHKGATVHPDLAVKFTDGYGIEYEVTYAVSAHEGYEPNHDAVYPQQDVKEPRVIVRKVKSPDGTGGAHDTTYSYFGATRDVKGRGHQGFEKIEAVDSRNDLKHMRRFKRDFPYTGMLVEEEFRQGDGKLISSRIITPDRDFLDPSAHNERYFVYQASSIEDAYEVGGSLNGEWITRTVVNNTFDEYGNLTASTRTVSDEDAASSAYGLYGESWTVSISNSFSPDDTYWCLGLLTASSVSYSTSLTEPTVVRGSSFEIDKPHCRVSEETVEPGSSLRKAKSAYGYDVFGNVTKVTVTGQDTSGNPMTSRVREVKWGSANGTIGGTGQFPVTEIDALENSTTRTFHATFGSLLTETDPNGILVVENAYDDFSRLVASERADGTSTDFGYHACTVSGTYACENGDPSSGFGTNKMIVVATERDTGNGAIRDDWIYLDQFDRTVVEKSRMVSGSYSRIGTEYDIYGRIAKKSAPCTVSSCSYYWVTNQYDLLGRLVQQSRPFSEGSSTPVITTFLREGRKQKITDPKGKETIKVLDANGWMRRSQDHDGYYQLFSYDAAGSLIEVTDALSNDLFSAEYSYGIQAFQDATTDMDLGAWAYQYNSLGELVGWTDAKSQSFSQTYDPLSRVTSRTEPEGTTTFTFGNDANNHNIGRLAGVSMAGYSESFTYDSAGRLSSRVITTDQPYDIDYAYNNQGLLDTLTYPTSTFSTRVKVKYGYAYGILNTVTDWTSGSAGTVYWAANAHNARGQTTQETLGNGVVTARSFDAVTGWLNSIQSGLSGGNGLQNLGYAYDEVGNVTLRQENSLGLNEAFFYDNLHRLDNSTLNSTTNLALTYDAMGNITSRSDVNGGATWSYHGTKKHAVTTTGTGGVSFSYDANGNMTSRAGSTITWSSFNYPTGLATGSESATFYYGPDRQYYRQVYTGPASATGNEETHYVGGLLEKVYDGTAEDWRHTIRAEGRVVAIVSRKSTGPNAVHYALQDNQGSGSTLVDSAGTGYVRQSYTAFGLPRDGADWDGAVPGGDQGAINAITRRGYTGHSLLGSMGLIHMNGRVQDAVMGRFLSPDPYVPNPGFTQSYNRYAYVNNNPLSFIDPSGFCELGSGEDVSTCQSDSGIFLEILVRSSPLCVGGSSSLSAYCAIIFDAINSISTSELICLQKSLPNCDLVDYVLDMQEYSTGGVGSGLYGPGDQAGRNAQQSLRDRHQNRQVTQPQGRDPQSLASALHDTGAAFANAYAFAGKTCDTPKFCSTLEFVLPAPGGKGKFLASMSERLPIKASVLVRWAENMGWVKKQTTVGPAKYVDQGGVERMTLKRGSSRTPGSEGPHVALRNAEGQRIDPAGNPVSRRSPGNHTPVDWDLD